MMRTNLPAMVSWALAAVTIGSRADMARMRAVGQRVIGVYTKTAVLMLNVVLCFVLIELASTAAINGRSILLGGDEFIDARSGSSYYASQNWAPQYWREFTASRKQSYRPYVLWRRAAFAGRTINIDRNGVRSTPGATCASTSFKVFVFGGSTVWGTGSPDWGTLPARLQAELQHVSSRPVCVVNYGESAYVSTQSVLELLLQLQSGNVPNLVISYEGPNDAYSAYQSGKVGVPENVDQLAATYQGTEMNYMTATKQLLKTTKLSAISASLLLKVTHPSDDQSKLLTYQTMGIDREVLASSIARTYLGNYEIVDGLSRKYGFDFRFFWPPYIQMGKKPLLREEQALAAKVDPALDGLYQSVHRAVTASLSTHPKVVDITTVFDDYAELVWIDDMHVTPVGNQLLANKIVNVLSARDSGASSAATTGTFKQIDQ